MDHRNLFVLLLFFAFVSPWGGPAVLGAQSAENVFVVVNGDSSPSLAVANHYILRRQIPPRNVVYLEGIRVKPEDPETISSAKFREDVLDPVLKAIEQRGLRDQIHCIAYSAGFPTRVVITPEMERYLEYRQVEFDKLRDTPYASITSAIYFYDRYFSEEPCFLDEHANWYAQESFKRSRAFSSQFRWLQGGTVAGTNASESAESRRYLLSTVLAVVHPKGSTVEQARAQLTRSAAADGKNPHGTFYFAKHTDPRSRTRHSQFASVTMALLKMGFKVDVSDQKLPKSKRILGAMLGSPRLDWSTSNSTFAPGAICDNFTSFGGWFRKSQTNLTHFLNHGASGGVGTVCEPYTIARKIPTAAVFIHYVRGFTMAESIYQSVLSPSQLLVVGDPLCRPHAALPKFTVSNFRDKMIVREDLQIQLKASPQRYQVAGYFVYIDGVLKQTIQPTQPIQLRVAELAPGYHELSIVAFDNRDAQVTRAKRFNFFVVHPDSPQLPTLKLRADDVIVENDGQVSVFCDFPVELSVRLIQNSRVLAKFTSPNQPLAVSGARLGGGTTRVYASTKIDGQIVRGVPLEIQVSD